MTEATARISKVQAAAQVAESLAGVLSAVGRADLAERLRIAGLRCNRPITVVCVVGEFKQGKSSLVNALLGVDLCPIDDDLATSAITVVRHAPELAMEVRHRGETGTVVEKIDPAELASYVTEAGNPGNERRVERVDIGLPHPLLANGLVLVDTPGMGGLGAGHAAATLAFLPYADGLLFVTDATAEVTATERAFLDQAVSRCPATIVALTKIDIAPAWRRISDLDRGHLHDAGAELTIVPVSSVIARLAGTRQDDALLAESGLPALTAAIALEVAGPAKEMAAARAIAEARAAASQVRSGFLAELGMLEDPSTLQSVLERLKTSEDRLAHLRGPGARWSTLVGDRLGDLSNEVTYAFRRSVRDINREFDEKIEELKSPKEWTDLSRLLATRVSEAVADVFAQLEAGVDVLRTDVVTLIGEDQLEIGEAQRHRPTIDVEALLRTTDLRDTDNIAKRSAGTAVTGLRGAQSGIYLLSSMSQLLPRAIGAFIIASPLALGIGAAFAGGQLLDAHRRKIAGRRQQARNSVRQFLDEVTFEIGQQLSDAQRLTGREIRDEFGERLAELQRTYAGTAAQAREDAQRETTSRAARAASLRTSIEQLDQVLLRLGQIEAQA